MTLFSKQISTIFPAKKPLIVRKRLLGKKHANFNASLNWGCPLVKHDLNQK